MRSICIVAVSALWVLACSEAGGPAVNGLNFVSPDPQSPAPAPLPTPVQPPQLVVDTFDDVIGPADDGCVNVSEARPCRRYPFSTTTGGTLRLTLTWTGETDLDLELWRGSNRLISVNGSGTTERLTFDLAAGFYEVRVLHTAGDAAQSYQLQITRPA